jgi:arylsulfatase A-like enzyme
MYDPNNIAVPDGLEMEWRSHPFAHYVQSRAYGFDNYTEKELKKLIAIYYGQITFIDKCVGTLMERVKELGLEEDTIVVFTADHGNFAGRYKLVGKTKAFYDALIRIPLIMKIPGIKKKRVKFNISNLDVMPTLIKATGIKTEINVQGKSFLKGIDVGHWDERDTVYAEIGDTEKPPPAMPPEEFKSYEKDRLKKDGLFWFIDYTVKGRGAMIREKDWKYCFYTDDREELYHLREDPLELYNLAKDKNHASRKDSLKSKLIEWLLV